MTAQDLTTRAQEVRDEKRTGANTATRVGQLFYDIILFFNNLVSKKQNIEDNSLETENKTVTGAINEVKQSVGNISIPDISGKQDKQDDNLETTDQTVVGAINELHERFMNNWTDLQEDGAVLSIGQKLTLAPKQRLVRYMDEWENSDVWMDFRPGVLEFKRNLYGGEVDSMLLVSKTYGFKYYGEISGGGYTPSYERFRITDSDMTLTDYHNKKVFAVEGIGDTYLKLIGSDSNSGYSFPDYDILNVNSGGIEVQGRSWNGYNYKILSAHPSTFSLWHSQDNYQPLKYFDVQPYVLNLYTADSYPIFMASPNWMTLYGTYPQNHKCFDVSSFYGMNFRQVTDSQSIYNTFSVNRGELIVRDDYNNENDYNSICNFGYQGTCNLYVRNGRSLFYGRNYNDDFPFCYFDTSDAWFDSGSYYYPNGYDNPPQQLWCAGMGWGGMYVCDTVTDWENGGIDYIVSLLDLYRNQNRSFSLGFTELANGGFYSGHYFKVTNNNDESVLQYSMWNFEKSTPEDVFRVDGVQKSLSLFRDAFSSPIFEVRKDGLQFHCADIYNNHYQAMLTIGGYNGISYFQTDSFSGNLNGILGLNSQNLFVRTKETPFMNGSEMRLGYGSFNLETSIYDVGTRPTISVTQDLFVKYGEQSQPLFEVYDSLTKISTEKFIFPYQTNEPDIEDVPDKKMTAYVADNNLEFRVNIGGTMYKASLPLTAV
jgi:hypothetical protein